MNKTRRIETGVELLRILAAIAIAYTIALIILFSISDDPLYIIQQFITGPLSSARRIGSVINLAIPFTFTGLCMCFMYAVNKFNLVGEGIFMLSGCVVSLVAINLAQLELPMIVMVIILFVVGIAVGAAIAMIPAYLDIKFKANIVVVSLMLNSILAFLSLWLLRFKMRDPTINFLASYELPLSSQMPHIFGAFKIQSGVLLAIAAVIGVSILFYKTTVGYKMRVVGSNPSFARAAGIPMIGTVLIAQMIGGAFAGIGGACEIMGNYTRFKWINTTQHGFDGLLVAVLARKNPALVPITALLLAYIRIGADVVNTKGDIPVEFITVVQGIIILLVAAQEFMAGFKKKLIFKAAKENLAAEQSKLSSAKGGK